MPRRDRRVMEHVMERGQNAVSPTKLAGIQTDFHGFYNSVKILFLLSGTGLLKLSTR